MQTNINTNDSDNSSSDENNIIDDDSESSQTPYLESNFSIPIRPRIPIMAVNNETESQNTKVDSIITANWVCPICHQDQVHPMMIIVCGHSFCQGCLEQVTNCPECRQVFNLAQLKTNYSLMSKKSKSEVKVKRTLEERFENINKLHQQLIKQQTRELLELLLELLEKQMIKQTSLDHYSIIIDGDIDQVILEQIKEELSKQEIELRINKFISVVQKTNSYHFNIFLNKKEIEEKERDRNRVISNIFYLS